MAINEDPIRLAGAQLDQEPLAAGRAGSGDQTEQACGVPTTQACECLSRKALDRLMEFCRSLITLGAVETPRSLLSELEAAALSAPCPCEQLRAESAERLRRWLVAVSRAESRLSPEAEAELRAELAELKAQETLAWKEANGLDDKLSILHDQLAQAQEEVQNGKELLAGKALTIQQLRSELATAQAEITRLRAELTPIPALRAERDKAIAEAERASERLGVVAAKCNQQSSLLDEAREALGEARKIVYDAGYGISELPDDSANRSCGLCIDATRILDAVIPKIDALLTPADVSKDFLAILQRALQTHKPS